MSSKRARVASGDGGSGVSPGSFQAQNQIGYIIRNPSMGLQNSQALSDLPNGYLYNNRGRLEAEPVTDPGTGNDVKIKEIPFVLTKRVNGLNNAQVLDELPSGVLYNNSGVLFSINFDAFVSSITTPSLYALTLAAPVNISPGSYTVTPGAVDILSVSTTGSNTMTAMVRYVFTVQFTVGILTSGAAISVVLTVGNAATSYFMLNPTLVEYGPTIPQPFVTLQNAVDNISIGADGVVFSASSAQSLKIAVTVVSNWTNFP